MRMLEPFLIRKRYKCYHSYYNNCKHSYIAPYGIYSTEFNNNTWSDHNCIEFYKYWETLPGYWRTNSCRRPVCMLTCLISQIPKSSQDPVISKYRDSLSSVKLLVRFGHWKNHSVKDSADYINVWYKEIDTLKMVK